MIANVAGSPVEGDSFFDREAEIQRLWSRLDTDSVLLLAPRRVGKTSLMYRLRDTAAPRHFVSVYASVADCRTELDFVRKLDEGVGQDRRLKRAVQQMRKSMGRLVRRVRKVAFIPPAFELDEAGLDQETSLGKTLADELSRDLGSSRRWLLLIDELPVFILTLLRDDISGTRARVFLNWFRQLRLEPAVNPRVRWLIAGSIGLDTVTRRARLSDTINDLVPFDDFGPFSDETCDRFLTALANRYGLPLSEDVRAHIRRRLGWLIPYHLQLVFWELRTRSHDGPDGPTDASVDAAFERLLSPAGRAYFDYWDQRLHEELGSPDAGHAIALLNTAASDPAGAPLTVLQSVLGQHVHDKHARDSKLRYLLDVLQSDGYLVREGDRMRFRSALLVEFWRRRLTL